MTHTRSLFLSAVRYAALTLAIAAAAELPAAAAPDKAGSLIKPDSAVPTKVSSDRMTYEADKLTVLFSGSVHVVRPDMEMWSDKLTLYLKADDKKKEENASMGMGAGSVERLRADGNVRLRAGERKGTCARAEYDVNKAVLTMSGEPRLEDGENMLTGETIRYYSTERRSEVTSSSSRRVEAIFSAPAPQKIPGKGKR